MVKFSVDEAEALFEDSEAVVRDASGGLLWTFSRVELCAGVENIFLIEARGDRGDVTLPAESWCMDEAVAEDQQQPAQRECPQASVMG